MILNLTETVDSCSNAGRDSDSDT